MGVRSLLKNSLAALVIGAASIAAMPSGQAKPRQEISIIESKAEDDISALLDNSRYIADPGFVMNDSDFEFKTDSLRDGSIGVGGMQQIMNFIFAVPGKLRRPSFMAYKYFGKRRPNYVELDWHKFLSQHLVVGAYDGELHLLDDFIKFEEEVFNEFRGRFEFSQFHKKPIVLMYKNGNEFLQDKLFYPDRGTAGVTKVLGRNEMATYFNGYRQDFAHTNKHESAHWFDLQFMDQIEKETNGSPLDGMELWMIEGLAEYYSVGWRVVHEQILRDLWHNNIFIPIEQLPRFQGSFLTYTFGNFYTKFLEETFGPGTALRIRENAAVYEAEENLEETTGKKLEDLNRMAQDYLADKFKDMEGKVDARPVLAEGYLLAADSGRFLTWDFDEGHIRMYLSKVNEHGVVKKRVVQDFEYGFESLMTLFFGGSAGLRDDEVIFSVNDSGRDKLVLQRFVEEEEKFSLESRIEKAFGHIDNIYSPQFMNYSTVMFVGSVGGQHDIFTYNFSTDRLDRLTNDRQGINGLDVRGEWVVFSREDEKASNPSGCDYDFNLHLMNWKTGEAHQLTFGESDEVRPRFSPDGRFIVFQRDVDFVNNLFVYDLDTGLAVRLDRELTGAVNPQFLDPDTFVLNTRTKLVPQVRVKEFDNPDALVRKELEMITADDIGTYRIRKNELLLKDALEASDGKFTINDREVTEIISHNGSLYFINEKDLYKKSGSMMSRQNPVPHEKRVSDFLKNIPEDVDFLEKNALIYDVKVSEDGTKAVVFLNEEFFDRKAFGKYADKILDDATPILVYSGIQSLIDKNLFDGKDNVPVMASEYFITTLREKAEVEFLMNDQFLMHNSKGVAVLSPAGSGNLMTRINDMLKQGGIGGKISDLAVSKDKRFVAFSYFDDGFFGDEHTLVVYDSQPGNAMIVSNTEEYKISNVSFLDNNRLFFAQVDDEIVSFYSFDPVTRDLMEKVHSKIDDEKLVSVAATANDIVFSTKAGDLTRLYATKFGKAALSVLSQGSEYSEFRTLDDVVTYLETDVYGKDELKTLDYRTLVISPDKVKDIGHDRMIVSDGGALYDVDVGNNRVRSLSGETFGFDVKDGRVLFSKAVKNVFNIFTYTLATGEVRQLTDNRFNSFRPVFADDAVYYEAEEGGRTHVRRIKGGVDEKIPLNNPAADLEFVHGDLQARVLEKEGKSEPKEGVDYSYSEGVRDTSKFSPWPVHEPTGAIVGAYDGRYFLLALDYIGFNELHTGLSFASIYYSTGFKLGNIGYADLENDFAVKADIVGFGDSVDTGLAFIKSFPFNAYLGLESSIGINYQDYPNISIENTRHNVYPTVSTAVSYDDTTFDYLRGPREGTRGFLRFETGYSITDNILNHYDVNADVRNYIPFIGRWGISQRLMAGTSQGYNNHFFLLGGNISMRGVNFDSLFGQNYAVANLDMQFPMFEAVGAAIAGTNFLMPIFSAFDVRAGPYFDAGIVFNNDDNVKPIYSAGYDINAICFGAMILRYNKGLWGKKGWNFWFGYNP